MYDLQVSFGPNRLVSTTFYVPKNNRMSA